MPIFLLDENNPAFPPPHMAEPEGLLAIGGDLSPGRLEAAYRAGIFPWYQQAESVILWWSPDPRFVLFPHELHVPRSLARTIKKNIFTFTIDKAFPQVISACAKAARKAQPFDDDEDWLEEEGGDADINVEWEETPFGGSVSADGFEYEEEEGLPCDDFCCEDPADFGLQPNPEEAEFLHTWLGPDMQAAYIKLHEAGLAHSVEAWQDGELAGGFYGIAMGSVVFGESMFFHKPDASKAAFAWFVNELRGRGCTMIDCQQDTSHLARFGARSLPRQEFLRLLEAGLKNKNLF